jgi:hypothetical protein
MAVLVALLLAIAAQPAPAAARPLLTGITNVDTTQPPAFQQVRATGARFIRIPLDWKSVVPEAQPSGWQPEDPSDPNYDWSPSDGAVIEALNTGLTPVLDVGGAPSWAQRCNSPAALPYALCDPDPAALAAFATAAARHYSGRFPGIPRVRYWQALNEPNLSIFFFPQFDTAGKPLSPGLYRSLVNSFYGAVKSVDGSNLVLSAGLGPIAVPPWTMGPMRFARLLLCMTGARHPHPAHGSCGGGVHFDIFAIQPYTTGGPTHEGGANDVELGDLPKLQRLLRAADRAGRIKGQFRRTPLWVTEFSWDSKPPDPGGLPMKIETRWVAEALYRAWSAGVSHFFWYSLRDEAYDPSRPFSETLQSGLYFHGPTPAQDQPKEALQAFRYPFVAYPRAKGLHFWGRTPSSRRGKVAIQLWKQGHWHRAGVVRASAPGIFSGTIRTSYGHDRRGSARAVFHGHSSAPFAMKPVPDFRLPPFG